MPWGELGGFGAGLVVGAALWRWRWRHRRRWHVVVTVDDDDG